MTVLEALKVTAESVRDWANRKFARHSKSISEISGVTQLVPADFVNGQIEQGAITQSDYWIVNQEPLFVKQGGRVTIEIDDGHKIWWKLVNNKDLSVATNIYNGGAVQENVDYIAKNDGWLVVQIAKVSGQKITPEECRCNIVIDNNRIGNLETAVDKLNGFTKLSAANFTNHRWLKADQNPNGNVPVISSNKYWIMTTAPIKINAADRVVIKYRDDVNIYWHHLDGSDIINSNIINYGVAATQDVDYTASSDGWLVIQIAKISAQTISPDEYDFDITIYNNWVDKLENQIQSKQEALVSGENIKTINGESILGSGDISVIGGSETILANTETSGALFSKHNPFAHIVDDCQDASKWTITNTSSDVVSVDTDNKILGTHSLHSNKEMRSTKNTYDLTKDCIVLKLKVNSIGRGSKLLLSIANTSAPNAKVVYELARGNAWTTPEDWQEIIISSNNYSYGSVDAIDFSNINDLWFKIETNEMEVDWNLQYVGTRPKTTNKGIVTFAFDDGWDSQYTGVKLLAEKGITSTIFAIKEAVETNNYLTLDNLKSLVNLYGTDIEVHGDPSYDQWDEEDLKAHWSESQKFIRDNKLGNGNHMAYPNGIFPENVVELAKDYFDSCRTITPYLPVETLPVADRYRIRAVSSISANAVTSDKVKEYIDRVAKDGGWLILVLHKIGDTTGDSMYCSEADLNAIADYAIDSGVDIMNYAEVMDRFYAELSPEQDIYGYIDQYKHITKLEGEEEYYIYNLNDGIYAVGIDNEPFTSNSIVYFDDSSYEGISDGIVIVSSLLNESIGSPDGQNEVAWIAIGSDAFGSYGITSGITRYDSNADYYIAEIYDYQSTAGRRDSINESGNDTKYTYPTVSAVIDFINQKLALTSNALIASKSGAVCAFTNISPVSQSISVQLDKEPLANETVFVYSYGKNILPTRAHYDGSAAGYKSYVETNSDGSITVHKAKGYHDTIDINIVDNNVRLAPGIYTFSDGLYDESLRGKIYLKLVNDSLEFNTRNTGFDTQTIVQSSDTNTYNFEARLICDNEDDEFDCVLYPQLECGSVATEFASPKQGELLRLSSENMAGTIKALHPITTLISRSDSNVGIVCEYSQDINGLLSHKTINGESILGEGNIEITGGNAEIPELKTINGVSLIGSGNIVIEGVETDGESSDVSGLRAELKDSLGEKADYKDITEELTIISGGAIQTSGLINAGRTQGKYCEKIAVKTGEKYRISGSYNSAHALLCAYTADESLKEYYIKTDVQAITGVGENFTVKPFEYTVPEDVAFIACSTATASTYPLKIEKWVVEFNNIPELIDELEAKHNEDILKAEQKIEQDIVALDEKVTLTVENICPNSDFEDDSVWELGNTATSMSVKDNVATLINDGSGTQTRIRMPLNGIIPQGHIVYVQASIKSSPNAIWESFNFYTDASYGFMSEKPSLKNSKSLFNDYYGTFDFSQTTTSSVKLWITSTYNTSANAKNQVTQIKNVFICDLTESFGAGNEPSASEFYNILKAGGSWFKGSKQIFMVDLIKPTLPIVSDYVITVGENGDCQTINEAIEKASSVYPVYKKRGIKIEIRILDGTVIDEQILVESLDLSYISITTDNPDNKVIVTPTANNWDKNSVSHDSRGNMPFFAGEHGARLPVIKCLFSCTSPMLQIEDKTIGIVGYYCNRGSMGVMAVGAAYPENTTQSGAGDIEAEVGFEGFYDCVIANNNSEIVLRECIARNAGRYGIMSRHISRISARSADLTNCGTIIKEKVKNNEAVTNTEKETTAAAYADRSSMMDVRFADVSGSYNGIQAFNTSNATAVETIANNITNIVADAQAGSIINCDIMTIDNVKDVFKVSKGGSIVATGAKLSNVTGTKYNVTTDIYTSNGSIYVTANKESVSTIDQAYNPESKNAQSGVAIAQALAGFVGGNKEIKKIANLIVDCLNDVAWANANGETKLNALKNYIDSIEIPDTPDEPDTPEVPDEPEIDANGFEVVRVISNDEISHLTGYTENYPYYSSRNVRETYVPFDIPIEYNYTYILEYETSCTEKVLVAFQFVNQKVLNTVASNGNYSKTDRAELTEWIESGTPFSIPSESVNGSPIVAMRITFKKENEAAFVEGAGVTSVTIKRKAGRVE